jgi:glycosyltransferase involved in cell wall biosynthesis
MSTNQKRNSPNIAVAQLGARMHYAVPRILHKAGILDQLYTDICAVKGWPKLLHWLPDQLLMGGVKRLVDRIPKGIPVSKITSYNSFGLSYALRRMRGTSSAEGTRNAIWAGQQFAEQVVRSGINGAHGVYTFNIQGLELLRSARTAGLIGIVEQTIAHREVQRRLLREEHDLNPGWEDPPEKNPHVDEVIEREQEEWNEASVILCGSEFVRDSIAQSGGPVDKCKVVPYGVDPRFSLPERSPHEGPLRVLTVGSVGLRKGSPYVLKAAQQLGGKASFRMVGPVGVSEEARLQLSEHVEVTGAVPRSEMPQQYAWADVFLLPSICEGSATVTYEALAAGLPVVCTPNTGSIVRDGEEGFIVPIRDADAIAGRIHQLAHDSDLRRAMSQEARHRHQQEGNLDAYAKRLLQVVRGVTSFCG